MMGVLRFSFFLILVALGACFSFLSYMGYGDFLCFSSGCSIYKNYSFFGVSFYLIAFFIFVFYLVFSFKIKSLLFRFLVFFILFLNSFFLLFQVFFWPCVSCLIIAFFLGGTAFSIFKPGNKKEVFLIFFWFLLFFSASLGLLKDSIKPWALEKKDSPKFEVFFSPNCPACKAVVKDCLSDKELFDDLALYPVSKDLNEFKQILILKRNLDKGLSIEKAFAFFWSEREEKYPKVFSWDFFVVYLNLLKNKLVLAKMGKTRVPLFLSRDLSFFSENRVLKEKATLNDCELIPGKKGVCGSFEGKERFLPPW